MKRYFYRVDERLIHGQTAAAWHRRIQSDNMIVVSDQAVKDQIKKAILKMAAPAGVRLYILSKEKACDYFRENYQSREINMVIFEKLDDVVYLVRNGINIPVVNIGGMYYKPERKKYRKVLFLNEDEIETLKELGSLGVKLEYQANPGDKTEEVLDIIR